MERIGPIADHTSLVLSPVESDRLLVIDVLTGKPRFRPQTRARKLYVAGIRNDQYYVVSADKMNSYDLRSGKIQWTTPSDLVSPGQRINGYGVFSEASYFLPTTSNELIEVSLSSGEIVSRRQVRFPLGNLLAVDGEIISQGTTTLAVAYGEKSLQPRVDQILAKNPDDLDALVRKSELLMEQGKRTDAMQLLDRARTLDPKNDDVILLSVDAMLSSLSDPEAAKAVDVETLAELIDRPEQEAELLVLQILRTFDSDSKVDSDEQLEKAFALAFELSALLVKQPSLASLRVSALTDTTREFTLNAWLSARIADLNRLAGPKQRDKVNSLLSDHLNAMARYDHSGLSQLTSQFVSMSTILQPRRAMLRERLAGRGDALAIERLAWSTRPANEDHSTSLSISELLSLANLYSDTGWADDRRWIGSLIRERVDPDNDREILRQLERYPVMGISHGPEYKWPEGVDLKWQSSNQTIARPMVSERRYAATNRTLGKQTMGWQVVSDNNSPLTLLNQNGISRSVLIDGLNTRNASDKEILSGGLMLVLTPSELIAVDLFRVFQAASRIRSGGGCHSGRAAEQLQSDAVPSRFLMTRLSAIT